MALGGDMGLALDTAVMGPQRWDVKLFSESNGRWLVEVAAGREDAFQHLMEGVPLAYLGRVGGAALRIRDGTRSVSLALPAMRKAWTEAIPKRVVVS
jgi:phosphoribosylformylglycinamidine (FGAM) synthase-like enzyme